MINFLCVDRQIISSAKFRATSSAVKMLALSVMPDETNGVNNAVSCYKE